MWICTSRRRLNDRPHVDRSFREGRISYRHAKELCHWLDKFHRYLLGSDLYDLPALLEAQEHAFLEVALLTDPHTLAVELKKRVQAFAPAPAQKDADALDAARTASLQPGFDGGWDLTAALGEHAGQTLAAALNAWRRGDHAHGDLRTPARQRPAQPAPAALRRRRLLRPTRTVGHDTTRRTAAPWRSSPARHRP